MEYYKLHIYHKKTEGNNLKGNIDRIEYFKSLEEMDKRYRELFVYKDFGLNPTAWKQTENGWKRLPGY